jgi:UDP-3-O-[3-hydroxymyristoyl] glucosamine N-acyltransferase
MERNIESLLSDLGFNYHLNGNTKNKKIFRSVATIQQGKEEDLCYCAFDGEEAVSMVSKSNAGIILCKNSLKEFIDQNYQSSFFLIKKQQLIFVDNPRATFIKIINKIYNKDKKGVVGGISSTAIISESAISSDCYVGNNVTIGESCSIGNNTVISDRVAIVQNCDIGRDCTIQAGATIGSDGFAFERDQDSLDLEEFPHLSGVKIGNNVEICTNTSIARGSLSDTVIGDGTKLDALVHVAHNVVIGRNCELTAGTIIGGSTTIGDTSWMGLNCTLKNKISIGSRVIVGCGATVINDVPNEDIVAGVPAKSIKHKVSSDQLFLMAGQHQQKGKQYERGKYLTTTK